MAEPTDEHRQLAREWTDAREAEDMFAFDKEGGRVAEDAYAAGLSDGEARERDRIVNLIREWPHPRSTDIRDVADALLQDTEGGSDDIR